MIYKILFVKQHDVFKESKFKIECWHQRVLKIKKIECEMHVCEIQIINFKCKKSSDLHLSMLLI